jgi:cytidylate kinase
MGCTFKQDTMKNTLLNYMNKRFGEVSKSPYGSKSPGPVITISREPGCGGLKIAEKLAGSLNEFVTCKRWQVISKEILQQSAKELEIDPQKIRRVFTPNERSVFDEILDAFNAKSYKSDRAILKTVRDVIRTFAFEGCCIILGRAGHEIASDIEQSLHIRLVAPLDWRVDRLAFHKRISHQEAMDLIVELEKNREAFRKYYINKKQPEELYDLVIDVSKFPGDKIVQLIKTAVDLKGFKETSQTGVSYF